MTKPTTKSDPAIKDCTCAHEFQDSRYGKGKRLMNPIKKTGDNAYRCTVCLKLH